MVARRPLDDFLYSAMDQDWKLIYRPANPDASELFTTCLRTPRSAKTSMHSVPRKPNDYLRSWPAASPG